MEGETFPAVYILASRYRGTLYTGVTSALYLRVCDHIRREKQIKKWNRSWKFRIIEEMNPDWIDLHDLIEVSTTLVEAKRGPLSSQTKCNTSLWWLHGTSLYALLAGRPLHDCPLTGRRPFAPANRCSFGSRAIERCSGGEAQLRQVIGLRPSTGRGQGQGKALERFQT